MNDVELAVPSASVSVIELIDSVVRSVTNVNVLDVVAEEPGAIVNEGRSLPVPSAVATFAETGSDGGMTTSE